MSHTSAVWIQREIVRSPTARRAIGVVAFAAAMAFGAKVAVPLPGTPVPFTLQGMFVLLGGALLGARLGASSQGLYLAVGALGAPVFAAGGGIAYLLGPTAGYLWAFPLAAYATGVVFARGPGLGRAALAVLLGFAVIHAGGLAWLSLLSGPSTAFRWGILPFVGVDLLKAAFVVVLASRLRGRALELFG
jgi:biotin transport system substrate-specific component